MKHQLDLFKTFQANTICKIQVAEMSVHYNTKQNPMDQPKVSSAGDSVDILRPLIGNDMELREAFYCLYLNRANRVVGSYQIGIGGVAGVVSDVRLIFIGAIHSMASGIIVCHNHPSGNLTPSQADIEMTKRIKNLATMFDMQLLDHIILTKKEHYSFANEGML